MRYSDDAVSRGDTNHNVCFRFSRPGWPGYIADPSWVGGGPRNHRPAAGFGRMSDKLFQLWLWVAKPSL
jgi:hypothetical protein